MFCSKNLTKSTLISGPPEITKSFVFEAAVYWAEEGRRVIYITQTPLESLPSTYHDRNNFSPDAFKLMRFMYLPTYETLVEQLVDLHTFAVLPSVLLIENLDAYIFDPEVKDQPLEIHTARLLAFIQDSTNACSRILKNLVHLFVSISSREIDNFSYKMYFDNVWKLEVIDDHRDSENCQTLELYRHEEKDPEESNARKVFSYRNFSDGTLVLKQIFELFISDD